MHQLRQRSPFEFTGGNLCLDFANTVDNRAGESPQELLADYARVLRWGEESGGITKKTAEKLSALAERQPERSHIVLRDAVQLRDALYDVFSAVANHRTVPAAQLATINRAVQNASDHAQLAHGQRYFAWQWMCPEQHLDSMLWPVARAAADLLTSEDLPLVRQCASETCAWLFVDRTKNHRRRWCDMRVCGNRDKARRYYQRQKKA